MKWIRQFTYCSAIICNLPQCGVYPRGDSTTSAPSAAGIWENSPSRFLERPSKAGNDNADSLRGEAGEQVKCGCLSAPLPIDAIGNVATYEKGMAIIAFRLGVEQGDEIRAGDDTRLNFVNLHCAVRTPIKLPKWGHIAHMCLDIRNFRHTEAFLNSDREAAYKQLPLAPGRATLALVALRGPTTGKRMAFPPKALLF